MEQKTKKNQSLDQAFFLILQAKSHTKRRALNIAMTKTPAIYPMDDGSREKEKSGEF